MNILITGAKGQLGKAVSKDLTDNTSYTVVETDTNKLDITDIDNVRDVIVTNNINIIINCAAYTAVDRCENAIETAFKVNALGPRNLAIVCEEVGAKMIHISTDYVFDGEGSIPYREYDIINPQNIYGKSKALGEEYVREFCGKYFIIRTAWLYGEGNNFVQTMLRLADKHKKIQVVSDQYGNPTRTKDLARAIRYLIESENYGIYHGTCHGTCSWYEFAKKIFEIKDISIKVQPITTEEYITQTKRPKYSSLDNFMFRLIGIDPFQDWEVSLEEYLRENN